MAFVHYETPAKKALINAVTLLSIIYVMKKQ